MEIGKDPLPSATEESLNAGKKKSLMSVIASLTPGMLSAVPDSELLSVSSEAKASPAPSGIPITGKLGAPHMSLSDAGLAKELTPQIVPDNNTLRESGTGEDVMSNILHLLYQVATNKNSADEVLPPENDESILKTAPPPEARQAAIKQLMMSYANGTDRVRNILGNEVNILYECRQCRGIFRSLPNLIRHKTEYCTDVGLMSSFLNRAANSSKEDDVAFQRILDILHPPEPKVECVSFDEPIQQRFEQNVVKPFPGIRKFSEATPSLSMSINRNKYPIDLSKPTTSTNNDPLKSTHAHSASTFGKFFIGRPTPKSASPTLIKPYACPICKKQMVERKSVRRHLVSIHSLSVVEAYKAMSTSEHLNVKPSVPIPVASSPQYRPTGGGRSRRSAPSENLLRQCVEEIRLGPSRTIHVLPQEFILSSVQCPVCHRGLCRRTNVRRHLLEAHNLIIKGEKKYFQLKDIARNTTSNSPTLRRLRHLFTVSNRGPNVSENGTHPMDGPIGDETHIPDSLTVIKSEVDEVNSNAVKQPVTPNSNISMESNASVVENVEHLPKIEKIKFVESESDAFSTSQSLILDESARSKGSSLDRPACNELLAQNNSIAASEDDKKDEFMTMNQSRNFSNEIHTVSVESQDHTLNDDDTPDPEDEPPPKKLRQLAPMVSRSAGQMTSINGKLIGPVTQVSTSSTGQLLKPSTDSFSQIGQSKNGFVKNENGVKNMVIRRMSSESSMPTTSNNGRTLIKVELRNSHRTLDSASQNEKATAPSSDAKFDLGKLACFTCDKKFASPQDIRRHLISVHSFTTERALATCYDCSSVDDAAQAAGLEHGFDITNAKCLICQRYYFSRENLLKHLSRAHHMDSVILKDLQTSCSVATDEQDDEPGGGDSKSNHGSKESTKSTKSNRASTEENSETSKKIAPYNETIGDECTKEEAEQALKSFPKHNINVGTLRCVKCKQKCMKIWDFKVHVLKHLGLGFYRCKFCPRTARTPASRGVDMVKHFQEAHGIQVRSRDPTLQECRVNYQHLWEVYGIPQRKIP